MECECCRNDADAERFGWFRAVEPAQVVAIYGHRRHVMCNRCLNEIDAALDATSWHVQEWAKWRAAEANAARADRGRDAVAGDFLRVHALRTKLYNYWKAALDGRRESIREIREERKRAAEAAAGPATGGVA